MKHYSMVLVVGVMILMLCTLSHSSAAIAENCESPVIQNDEENEPLLSYFSPLPVLKNISQIGALLEAEEFRTGLELGPNRGENAALFLRHWRKCKRYSLIDPTRSFRKCYPPCTTHEQEYSQHLQIRLASNIGKISIFSSLCEFVGENNNNKARVDFVFVNSHRNASEIMADVKQAWNIVKDGGIIAGTALIPALVYRGDGWQHEEWNDDGDLLPLLQAFCESKGVQLIATYRSLPWPGWYFRKAMALSRPIPLVKKRELFAQLLDQEHKASAVEIGVCQGVFAEALLQRWLGCRQYFGIDPWEQVKDVYKDGANLPQKFHLANMMETEIRLRPFKPRTNVTLIRSDSNDAIRHFAATSIDFVYIDGRHDYVSVLQDIQSYWEKLKPGGIMAGHDFVDQSELEELEGQDQDWSLGPDGQRNTRAVRGAVEDFAFEKGVQVLITFDLDEHMPSWYMRKPESTTEQRKLQDHSWRWTNTSNNNTPNAPIDENSLPQPLILTPRAGMIFRRFNNSDATVLIQAMAAPSSQQYRMYAFLDAAAIGESSGDAGQGAFLSVRIVPRPGVNLLRVAVCSGMWIGPQCPTATHRLMFEVFPPVAKEESGGDKEERTDEGLLVKGNDSEDNAEPAVGDPLIAVCSWSEHEEAKDLLILAEMHGVDDNVVWITDNAAQLSGFTIIEAVRDGRRDYMCLLSACDLLLRSRKSSVMLLLPESDHLKLLHYHLLRFAQSIESFNSDWDLACAGRCDNSWSRFPMLVSRPAAELFMQSAVPFLVAGGDEINVHAQLHSMRIRSLPV